MYDNSSPLFLEPAAWLCMRNLFFFVFFFLSLIKLPPRNLSDQFHLLNFNLKAELNSTCITASHNICRINIQIVKADIFLSFSFAGHKNGFLPRTVLFLCGQSSTRKESILYNHVLQSGSANIRH